jgi:3D (Asp-Asp-Asp) domain-containing protein
MRLARSLRWKAFVTLLAVGGFVWLYEVTIPDSKFSMLPLALERFFDPSAPPAPGARIAFSATAYCKGLVTTSGVAVQKGVMAADPTLLPVGSVIDFSVDDPKYDGIYSILDTGPEIHGHEVDVYMWSCFEALRFGRKSAHVTVRVDSRGDDAQPDRSHLPTIRTPATAAVAAAAGSAGRGGFTTLVLRPWSFASLAKDR